MQQKRFIILKNILIFSEREEAIRLLLKNPRRFSNGGDEKKLEKKKLILS